MKKKKDFQAKKHLGQHFLINQGTQLRIIEHCGISTDDDVLEIGPGKGAITQYLVEKAKHVTAIEKDPQMVDFLKNHFDSPKLSIINKDILKYDFSDIQKDTILVGNLPYNISTPIIELLIKHKGKFRKLFVMLQLEYAQRLIAKEKTKEYGALSCFVQYHFQVKKLFNIGKRSFFPAPKVQSAFIQLLPKEKNKSVHNEKLLFQIIHLGFAQRRKTFLNALLGFRDKETLCQILEENRLNPKIRAEEISLECFIHIANTLAGKS